MCNIIEAEYIVMHFNTLRRRCRVLTQGKPRRLMFRVFQYDKRIFGLQGLCCSEKKSMLLLRAPIVHILLDIVVFNVDLHRFVRCSLL